MSAPVVDVAGDLGTDSLEHFYARAADLFEPGGPGRIDVLLDDSQILDLIELTGRSRPGDQPLFVVMTPAGIVGIRRKWVRQRPLAKVRSLDLADELRDGRHERGYVSTDWRERLRLQRRRTPTLTG